MTDLEIATQGWTYRNREMMLQPDGKTPVFFADIVAVHEPTRKWVEERVGCVGSDQSLDDFETGD